MRSSARRARVLDRARARGALLLAGLASLAAACGGGSSGGGRGGAAAGATGTAGTAAHPGFVGQDPDRPIVLVHQPARGAYLDLASHPSREVLVEGVASDPGSGVARVEVNGQVAQLDPSGAFRFVLALADGPNPIVVRAFDHAGNVGRSVRSVVFAERFVAPGQPIPHALGARFSELGLDALGPVIARAIAQSGLIDQQLLNGGQPLWQDHITFPAILGGGCFLSIQVVVQAVSYGAPTLSFDCLPGEITATMRLPSLVVSGEADDACGMPWPAVTGDIRADPAEVTLRMGVSVDPVSGRLRLDGRQATVTLHGYDVRFTNLPGQILGAFPVASALRAPIEQAIADTVRAQVPPRLESELNALLQPVSRTFLGQTVTMTLTPEAVSADDDGLTVDARVDVAGTRVPSLPAVPGAYFDPAHGAHLPLFPARTPSASVALLSNAWNRALHVSWQAGFWNLVIDQQLVSQVAPGTSFQLNGSVLASHVPGLAGFVPTGQNVPVALATELRCQPVLLPQPFGSPALARLALPELHLTLLMDVGLGYQPVWTFAIHAETDVDMQVVNGHQLALALGQRTFFEAELIASALPPNGMDLGHFLSFVMPNVLSIVGRSIGPFPLPPLGLQSLLTLQTPTVRVDGPAGDYIVIDGDL